MLSPKQTEKHSVMLTLLINNFNQDMLDRVKQSLGRRTDLGKHQLQTIGLSFIHKQHYREFNMEKKKKLSLSRQHLKC